eukprot:3474431-Ditylum_brightwellii.AAC.1
MPYKEVNADGFDLQTFTKFGSPLKIVPEDAWNLKWFGTMDVIKSNASTLWSSYNVHIGIIESKS